MKHRKENWEKIIRGHQWVVEQFQAAYYMGSWGSHRRVDRSGDRKNNWKNNDQIFSKFDETVNLYIKMVNEP